MKDLVKLVIFPAVWVQVGMYRLLGVPATGRFGDLTARPTHKVTRNQAFLSRMIPILAMTLLVLMLRWLGLA